MSKTRNRIAILALVAGAFLGAACSDLDSNDSASEKDEKSSEAALNDLQKAHPTPKFERSQLRQNLVDITTIQAEATQTTSFFFLEGVGIVGECPSIGFPIQSTTQLTNPEQEKGPRESRITLPLVEPTGVYTGDSSGTYVICVDAKGHAYARYWEGYVQTVTGPAEVVDNVVKLTGPSSFDFEEGNK